MTSRRFIGAVVPIVVSAAIIGWLVITMGTGPFTAAVRSLSPLSVVAALCAGAAATVIQAQRWRLVSRGFGLELRMLDAVSKCWQASFLNSVLPGGLAGDALRTVEQRGGAGGSWRKSIGAVGGERLVATVVTLAAAAIVLLPRELWSGVAVGAAAVAAGILAWVAIGRLSRRTQIGVLALSLAGWVVFVGLFAVAVLGGLHAEAGATAAAATTSSSVTHMPAADIVALAALTLAGMSVPLSLGGWGPREGAAALGFVLFGYSAQQGVAAAVSYGILALVSVLPGALVILLRTFTMARTRQNPPGT